MTAGVLLAVVLAVGAATSSTGSRIALVVASSLLGTASAVPCIRATLRGTAQPPLVMWATWCALTALAGFASASSGDYPSAVFALVGTLATGAVVVIAFRAGDRAFSALDAVCVALLVPGLVVWQTLHAPQVAVLTACLIDLVGVISALPTLWRRPDQQPTSTFALICAGGLCAALAAWGSWSITALAYPIYVAVSTGAMALLTLRRTTHLRLSERNVDPQQSPGAVPIST